MDLRRGMDEHFNEWLARTHPDVMLTPMQQDWVNARERGEQVAWAGGRQTGRTFVFNLYTGFVREQPQ